MILRRRGTGNHHVDQIVLSLRETANTNRQRSAPRSLKLECRVFTDQSISLNASGSDHRKHRGVRDLTTTFHTFYHRGQSKSPPQPGVQTGHWVWTWAVSVSSLPGVNDPNPSRSRTRITSCLSLESPCRLTDVVVLSEAVPGAVATGHNQAWDFSGLVGSEVQGQLQRSGKSRGVSKLVWDCAASYYMSTMGPPSPRSSVSHETESPKAAPWYPLEDWTWI